MGLLPRTSRIAEVDRVREPGCPLAISLAYLAQCLHLGHWGEATLVPLTLGQNDVAKCNKLPPCVHVIRGLETWHPRTRQESRPPESHLQWRLHWPRRDRPEAVQDGGGGWAARVDWGEGLKSESESVTGLVVSNCF